MLSSFEAYTEQKQMVSLAILPRDQLNSAVWVGPIDSLIQVHVTA